MISDCQHANLQTKTLEVFGTCEKTVTACSDCGIEFKETIKIET